MAESNFTVSAKDRKGFLQDSVAELLLVSVSGQQTPCDSSSAQSTAIWLFSERGDRWTAKVVLGL